MKNNWLKMPLTLLVSVIMSLTFVACSDSTKIKEADKLTIKEAIISSIAYANSSNNPVQMNQKFIYKKDGELLGNYDYDCSLSDNLSKVVAVVDGAEDVTYIETLSNGKRNGYVFDGEEWVLEDEANLIMLSRESLVSHMALCDVLYDITEKVGEKYKVKADKLDDVHDIYESILGYSYGEYTISEVYFEIKDSRLDTLYFKDLSVGGVVSETSMEFGYENVTFTLPHHLTKEQAQKITDDSVAYILGEGNPIQYFEHAHLTKDGITESKKMSMQMSETESAILARTLVSGDDMIPVETYTELISETVRCGYQRNENGEWKKVDGDGFYIISRQALAAYVKVFKNAFDLMEFADNKYYVLEDKFDEFMEIYELTLKEVDPNYKTVEGYKVLQAYFEVKNGKVFSFFGEDFNISDGIISSSKYEFGYDSNLLVVLPKV